MNDCRRSKRAAGLRRTVSDGHVGDERYDDELQSDQGAGSRSHDYVEVLPPGKFCHVITWSSLDNPDTTRLGPHSQSRWCLLRQPRYCSSLTLSIQSTTLPSSFS